MRTLEERALLLLESIGAKTAKQNENIWKATYGTSLNQHHIFSILNPHDDIAVDKTLGKLRAALASEPGILKALDSHKYTVKKKLASKELFL